MKNLFKAIWHTISGVFIFGSHWHRQKERMPDFDPKYLFKEKVKKSQAVVAVTEKRILGQLSKRLEKKNKLNRAIYNYIRNCIFTLRPGMSMEGALEEFYDYLHPVLVNEHEQAKLFRSLLRNKNPEEMIKCNVAAWKTKYLSRTNFFSRSEIVLEDWKAKVLEIKKANDEVEALREKESTLQDKKVLEADTQRLELEIEKLTKYHKSLKTQLAQTPNEKVQETK